MSLIKKCLKYKNSNTLQMNKNKYNDWHWYIWILIAMYGFVFIAMVIFGLLKWLVFKESIMFFNFFQ